MYTELELLAGLKNRDLSIMKHLYAMYLPMIRDLIQKNGGSEEDASDIFQDGMVVIFEKTKDPTFHLTSTLKTYLYAVCRNKWLMQLRRRRTQKNLLLSDTMEVDSMDDAYQDIIDHEKKELMRKQFKLLGTDCQRVLQMFFDGASLRKIAEVMAFTEAYAKKRKFICQKRLIEAISKDPVFRELSIS